MELELQVAVTHPTWVLGTKLSKQLSHLSSPISHVFCVLLGVFCLFVFMWALGIELKTSCLHSKYFTS